jgi:hypothetical protein
MQYPKFPVKPVVALLLAISLGACVGYTGYPSGDYGYSQPNYRYSGYPSSYYGRPSYSQRSYYSPYYVTLPTAVANCCRCDPRSCDAFHNPAPRHSGLVLI